MFKAIFIAIALLLSGLACSAEKIPREVLDVLQHQFPSSKLDQELIVLGDLNKDGLTDFATLLGDPSGEEELKIVAFFGKSGGGYQIVSLSPDIEHGGRASVWIEIKKQSLFLHRSGSGGCCSDWVEVFQFKIRDNDLVLIGEEHSVFARGDELSEYGDYGKSVNFLTNEVRHWRKSGKKRKDIVKKFAPFGLTKLRSFNYRVHESRLLKEVPGYIDASFTFKQ